MGDRVSIQFANGSEMSPVLFSHWDGKGLITAANMYARKLVAETEGKETNPLDRLETGTVMIDFLYHYLTEMFSSKDPKSYRIEFGYYLTRSEHEGDNSDNGHHIIHLDELDPLKTIHWDITKPSKVRMVKETNMIKLAILK